MTEWTTDHSKSTSYERRSTFFSSIFVPIGLCLMSCIFCYVILDRFSIPFLAILLAAVIGMVMLTYRAVQESSFSLMLWFLSMAGVRNLMMLKMPGLPDFTFERAFMVWILLMFLIRALFRGEKLRQPYLADIFILVHTLYVLVNLYFNNSEHFHYWVMSEAGPAIAFFYGKNLLKRDAELRNLIYFFLALVIYFSWTAICQYFEWNALIWPKSILDTDRGLHQVGRVGGPFNHPPLFGQVFGMLLLVVIFLIVRAKAGLAQVIYFFIFVISCIGMLFTYTRGPWLATAASILFMGVLRPKFRKFIGILAVVGVFVAFFGLFQLANDDFFQERMSNKGTVDNRLGFLANAARMIKDHPFFGVGYFRFSEFAAEYNTTTSLPFYGTIKKDSAEDIPIHDIYIGRMAEEGLVGIFFHFGFYFIILHTFINRWRAGFWSDWLNLDTMTLIAGLMVNYLIGGMIIDFRYFGLVNVLFYFFAGIIYGYHPEITDPRYQQHRELDGKEAEH